MSPATNSALCSPLSALRKALTTPPVGQNGPGRAPLSGSRFVFRPAKGYLSVIADVE